ncbi:universal stress protein [Chachezhania antarctica]|uniref:universal stress protein n=1 Tax=Chachezhania antarctica TaxID=2340860 RepID=UPI000EAC480D|nr:universal stress protein [Chachezhania antarctica]|tara:strand:- start:1624 stop:2043 length:420 start_codon:yes stop_codon:yes gene_type:complete
MFAKIMVPVDLAHADRLTRALTVTADMAKQYGAEVIFVGVSTAAPTSVAHTPEEYAEKLKTFAADQGTKGGFTASSDPILSHDPSVDLNKALLKAISDTGAELVIMASHVPGALDYVLGSHGGHLASHAHCSVLLIREG